MSERWWDKSTSPLGLEDSACFLLMDWLGKEMVLAVNEVSVKLSGLAAVFPTFSFCLTKSFFFSALFFLDPMVCGGDWC